MGKGGAPYYKRCVLYLFVRSKPPLPNCSIFTHLTKAVFVSLPHRHPAALISLRFSPLYYCIIYARVL